MKYLKNFETLDYRQLLAQEADLRKKLELSREEEIEKLSKSMSGQRLKQLEIESDINKRQQQTIEERQELTHVVVQSLIYSELNKPGFENFKEDLKSLLSNYPTGQLPKSGTSIYRSSER